MTAPAITLEDFASHSNHKTFVYDLATDSFPYFKLPERNVLEGISDEYILGQPPRLIELVDLSDREFALTSVAKIEVDAHLFIHLFKPVTTAADRWRVQQWREQGVMQKVVEALAKDLPRGGD